MSFKQKLSEKTGIAQNKLPASYQIIGDILLLKLMKIKSGAEKKRIASAIMGLLPYIKTVCELKSIKGEFRKPKITKLAGKSTVTMHKEHGILYKLDVSKIMFSKGNLFERKRIAEMVKKNEVIVDMFAGIGYFSIGLAKKSKKVHAIEKNKTAYRYLKENIRLNSIKNIEPILGDNRKIKLENIADRIIMGYMPKTEKFLPAALKIAKKKCIIHFHNAYKESDLWEKPLQDLKILGKFKILNKKIVKSIGPRRYHVVVDLQRH